MPRKAPEMPAGPNPALAKGWRVEPYGRAWAVVQGLGIASTHKLKEEAEAALLDRQRHRGGGDQQNDERARAKSPIAASQEAQTG